MTKTTQQICIQCEDNLTNVRYSIGADDDFQHHSYPTAYPSAPTDNEPYNPGYYDRQVGLYLNHLVINFEVPFNINIFNTKRSINDYDYKCSRSPAWPYLAQDTMEELECTALDQ